MRKLAPLLVFVIIVADIGCGTRSLGKKVYATEDNRDKVIGSLGWVAYDTATSQVLAQGSKNIILGDVTITAAEDSDGRTFYSKRITLGNNFSIGITEFPKDSRSSLVGFGITGTRDDVKSFSWEWFQVDRPGHATKIQETGELAFTMVQVGNKWEVGHVEFLNDISLRVIPFGEGANPLDPKWRISIAKGSTIEWPSLVNGKVVSN